MHYEQKITFGADDQVGWCRWSGWLLQIATMEDNRRLKTHRCKNHFPLLAYDNNNLNCAVFPGYSLERKADIVSMCKSFLSNDRCCWD